ncbi:MAG: tandem-95 repeat protein [Acidobacteriota bacterium]
MTAAPASALPRTDTIASSSSSTELPLLVDGFETGDDSAWQQAVAQPLHVEVGQGTTKTLTLVGTSPSGAALTFTIDTPPAVGSLGPITPISATEATVDYTAPGSGLDPVEFCFQVDDGIRANVGTVNITRVTVTPPVADDLNAFTDEDLAVTLQLTGSDQELDDLTFRLLSAPANGALGSLTSTGTASAQVLYTPNDDWSGVDSFQFEVDDGNGGTDDAIVQINVQPINDAPVADDAAETTPRGVAVVVTLTASDIEGDSLTFLEETGPSQGTLSAVTPIDGTTAEITYTPPASFTGQDSFTFRTSDPSNAFDLGTVTITVEPATDYTLDTNARGVWFMEEDIDPGGGAAQVDTRLDATAAANHLTTDFDVTLNTTNPPQGSGAADFPNLQGDHLDRHNPNGALAPPFLSNDFPGVADSDYTIGLWALTRTTELLATLMDMNVMRLQIDTDGNIQMSHQSTSGYHLVSSPSALNEDQWYHVAVRFDRSEASGEKLTLFVDGQPVASSSNDPPDLNTTIEQFTIGSDIFGNRELDGLVDEAFVFNRALDDDEIEELYLCGADGSGC